VSVALCAGVSAAATSVARSAAALPPTRAVNPMKPGSEIFDWGSGSSEDEAEFDAVQETGVATPRTRAAQEAAAGQKEAAEKDEAAAASMLPATAIDWGSGSSEDEAEIDAVHETGVAIPRTCAAQEAAVGQKEAAEKDEAAVTSLQQLPAPTIAPAPPTAPAAPAGPEAAVSIAPVASVAPAGPAASRAPAAVAAVSWREIDATGAVWRRLRTYTLMPGRGDPTMGLASTQQRNAAAMNEAEAHAGSLKQAVRNQIFNSARSIGRGDSHRCGGGRGVVPAHLRRVRQGEFEHRRGRVAGGRGGVGVRCVPGRRRRQLRHQ
jgi:hypothetical protein